MNRATIPTGWALNPDGSPGYTWNPITGCNNQIDGMCLGGNFPCYAYRIANGRVRNAYLANKNTATKNYDEDSYPFYPRLWEDRLDEIPKLPAFRNFSGEVRVALQQNKRRGVFVCDMSDLFGIGIPEHWTQYILDIIKRAPDHRFYLLTKQPQNLAKFSPFPDTCWVGVSATDNEMAYNASCNLVSIQASIKYISFEPLLGRISPAILDLLTDKRGIKWVIIGSLTGSWKDIVIAATKYAGTMMQYGNKWTLQPPMQYVREIVEACDKAEIPVFLKGNLKPLLETLDITTAKFGRLTSLKAESITDTYGSPRQRGWYGLRQELPK